MATQNIFNLTDQWNNVATTFTAIKMNATDTASAAGSMLIDLQVDGTTQFHVLKSGAVHTKRSNYNITNTNAASILVSNYSLTGSDATSMFDLAGTWNTSGAPTAIKLNMTDTASASGSLLLDLQRGGVSQFNVRRDGVVLAASDLRTSTNFRARSDTGSLTLGLSDDTVLLRDAADTLAQRRGTNAQAFRIYNTYTDASNYERGSVRWVGNGFKIGAEAGGTGTLRSTVIDGATVAFTIGGSGTIWTVNASGHFVAGADNTYDIGASAATRPRNLYMASWIRMAVTTVANLPAAATAGAGARMMVSDALAPMFGSAVAGSGAVTVPVYSTGAAWNVG